MKAYFEENYISESANKVKDKKSRRFMLLRTYSDFAKTVSENIVVDLARGCDEADDEILVRSVYALACVLEAIAGEWGDEGVRERAVDDVRRDCDELRRKDRDMSLASNVFDAILRNLG